MSRKKILKDRPPCDTCGGTGLAPIQNEKGQTVHVVCKDCRGSGTARKK